MCVYSRCIYIHIYLYMIGYVQINASQYVYNKFGYNLLEKVHIHKLQLLWYKKNIWKI